MYRDMSDELKYNHLDRLLKEFPDKPWSWRRLSANPNITFQNVLYHPDKPWDWQYLSSNPSITFQNVLDNPEKPWDWERLSSNKFNKDPIVKKKLEKRTELRKRVYPILDQYLIADVASLVTMFF